MPVFGYGRARGGVGGDHQRAEAEGAAERAHGERGARQADGERRAAAQVGEGGRVSEQAYGDGGEEGRDRRRQRRDCRPFQRERDQRLPLRRAARPQQRDLAPPPLRRQRRQRRHAVQRHRRYQNQRNEHLQPREQQPRVVNPQRRVQLRDLAVRAKDAGQRVIQRDDCEPRPRRVRRVQPFGVHVQRPSVIAVHLRERGADAAEQGVFRNHQRRDAEIAPREGVQNHVVEPPDGGVRVAPFVNPAYQRRRVWRIVAPVRDERKRIADAHAELVRRVRRDQRLHAQRSTVRREVQKRRGRLAAGKNSYMGFGVFQKLKIAARVVAARFILRAGRGEEERGAAPAAQNVFQQPSETVLILALRRRADGGVLIRVRRPLRRLGENVQIHRVVARQRRPQRELAQRIEVDNRPRHDHRRHQNADDHRRQQPPIRQTPLRHERPSGKRARQDAQKRKHGGVIVVVVGG